VNYEIYSDGKGKYLRYVVKRGDTLYSIAVKFKSVCKLQDDIIDANPGKIERANANIKLGETLKIPITNPVYY
jgi:LysM repeat protein